MCRKFPRAMPRILSRAINKVAGAARTFIVRVVAGQISIKQKDLKQQNVKLRKASFRRLVAVILIMGGRIPLKRFAARQTKKGATYRIQKTGGRKTVAGAFIVETMGGHVFRRKGKTRMPIAKLFGPSVPQVVEDVAELAENTLNRRIGNNLEKEITTQTTLVLQRQ